MIELRPWNPADDAQVDAWNAAVGFGSMIPCDEQVGAWIDGELVGVVGRLRMSEDVSMGQMALAPHVLSTPDAVRVVKTALPWFRDLGVSILLTFLHAENSRCLRVAERAGFQRVPMLPMVARLGGKDAD